MDEAKNKPLKPGNYPTADGKVHHVLEVQDGVIDVEELVKRINKKYQEVNHGKVSG